MCARGSRDWLYFSLGGLFSGCGSSSDSSSPNQSTGRLSLAVTDAPVEEAETLYLNVTGVTLEDINGSQVRGPYPVTGGLVNLMGYTGTHSAVVLSDHDVPARTYKARVAMCSQQWRRHWLGWPFRVTAPASIHPASPTP
jgi:hypothetical protein